MWWAVLDFPFSSTPSRALTTNVVAAPKPEAKPPFQKASSHKFLTTEPTRVYDPVRPIVPHSLSDTAVALCSPNALLLLNNRDHLEHPRRRSRSVLPPLQWSASSRVLDPEYSTSLVYRREQLARAVWGPPPQDVCLPRQSLLESVKRLSHYPLRKSSADNSHVSFGEAEFLLGSGVLLESPLFESIFTSLKRRVLPESPTGGRELHWKELCYLNVVIYLEGDYDKLDKDAKRKTVLATWLQQNLGKLPYDLQRSTVHNETNSVRSGQKSFVCVLHTREGKTIRKITQRYNAGKLQTVSRYKIFDLKMQAYISFTGDEQSILKLKAIIQRGVLDRLCSMSPVGASDERLHRLVVSSHLISNLSNPELPLFPHSKDMDSTVQLKEALAQLNPQTVDMLTEACGFTAHGASNGVEATSPS